MAGGYAGKILHIDLSTETVSEYPHSAGIPLGGKALAVEILLELLIGRERAFSEENPVVLATGPLTGSGAPGSARFDIASLSPRDQLPAFSNCGGSFGIYLKKAGYDGLVLTGRCREKRWLRVSGEGITFHDAGAFWGTGTGECSGLLGQREETRQYSVLCIGPAGENLVSFASVAADGHCTGRAGLGAVLGWKNLKAIVVSGTGEIPIHNPEAALEHNRRWHKALAEQAPQAGASLCTGCPLRCVRHPRAEHRDLLDELGMDAIAAREAAQEAGGPSEALFRDIAFRRGIGDRLAQGVPVSKGKGWKRRGKSYGVIAEAFGLPPETEETESFCRNFTEGISAAGQCVFTANGLRRGEAVPPVVAMLRAVTGRDFTLEDLVLTGKTCREKEKQLRKRMEEAMEQIISPVIPNQ